MVNNKVYPEDPVLIVEKNDDFIRKLDEALNLRTITNIKKYQDYKNLIATLEKREFSFILFNESIDMIIPSEIIKMIIDCYPKIPVIIISEDDRVEHAMEYMKRGVLYYYNYKKVDFEKLIDQIIQGIRLYENIKPIITRSKEMRLIFRDIARIAPTNTHVLIRGETGVGKELIAKAIHQLSGRKGNFLPANIASFDDYHFTDMLFGHKKGGFLGAGTDRNGLIEESREGTLFLDEIGDIKPDLQVKLLRLLQEGTYYRLGDYKEIKANSRIITATNRDIEAEIRVGRYREDFFQRLKSFTISIPPLRERKEDIPILVDHFIGKFSRDPNIKKLTPTEKFLERLKGHDFKGNIRELEGLINKLVIQYSGGEKLTVDLLQFQEEKQEGIKNTKAICFVIQPFDTVFNNRFKDIYKPAIEKVGLKAYRTDCDPGVSVPIEAIENGIRQAIICLADITTNNPNVWYELGFAFASGCEVVMVCSNERQDKKYPFDIQHRSIISYSTDSPSDYKQLRNKITEKISAYIKKKKNSTGC